MTTEFCEAVIAEYAKRFTESEIKDGNKGMDVHIARIAMDVFRIATEKLNASPTAAGSPNQP